MTVQGIHASEVLLAAFTWERPDVQMKLFVTFAIMLSSEPFPASGPFTLVRLLLRMRTQVT